MLYYTFTKVEQLQAAVVPKKSKFDPSCAPYNENIDVLSICHFTWHPVFVHNLSLMLLKTKPTLNIE